MLSFDIIDDVQKYQFRHLFIQYHMFNSLTTEKQTTNLRLQTSKNVKCKLYHIENLKTGWQTVRS